MAYYTTYDWSSGTNLDIDSTLNGSDTQIIEITSSMSGGNATLTLPSVEATGSGVDLGWLIQVVDTGGFIGESSTITIVPNPNDIFYTYKVNGSVSGFNWTSGNTAVVITYLNYGVWYVSSSFGATILNPTNNRILTSLDTGGVYSNAESALTFDGSDLNLIGGNGATGSDGMLFAQSTVATSSGTKFVHQSGTVSSTGNTDFVVAFNAGVDRNLLGVTCDIACYRQSGGDSFYAKVMFAALYNDDAGGNTVPTTETIYIFKDTSTTGIFTLDAVTASSAAELVLNIANSSANAYEVQVFWQINNASYDAP